MPTDSGGASGGTNYGPPPKPAPKQIDFSKPIQGPQTPPGWKKKKKKKKKKPPQRPQKRKSSVSKGKSDQLAVMPTRTAPVDPKSAYGPPPVRQVPRAENIHPLAPGPGYPTATQPKYGAYGVDPGWFRPGPVEGPPRQRWEESPYGPPGIYPPPGGGRDPYPRFHPRPGQPDERYIGVPRFRDGSTEADHAVRFEPPGQTGVPGMIGNLGAVPRYLMENIYPPVMDYTRQNVLPAVGNVLNQMYPSNPTGSAGQVPSIVPNTPLGLPQLPWEGGGGVRGGIVPDTPLGLPALPNTPGFVPNTPLGLPELPWEMERRQRENPNPYQAPAPPAPAYQPPPAPAYQPPPPPQYWAGPGQPGSTPQNAGNMMPPYQSTATNNSDPYFKQPPPPPLHKVKVPAPQPGHALNPIPVEMGSALNNSIISSSSTPAGNLSNIGGQGTKAAAGSAIGKRSSGGYRSGYSGGGYSGGGSGGSGGSSEGGAYEGYGMTPEWMQAYKSFWGEELPSDMYSMFQAIEQLFSRYANRMPQLYDWQRIWETIRNGDASAKNMWESIQPYEPMLQEQFVRQPLFTPPTVSYAPDSSF